MSAIERAYQLLTQDGYEKARELAVARQNAARDYDVTAWDFWDDVVASMDELAAAFKR